MTEVAVSKHDIPARAFVENGHVVAFGNLAIFFVFIFHSSLCVLCCVCDVCLNGKG